MRLGQKNGIVRQWARKGTRPRQPADQRHKSAYVFGAICPARGTGAAIVMPCGPHPTPIPTRYKSISTIGRHVAADSHAVIITDQAGWHTTGKLRMPENISILFLPPKSSELNPVENIWQYMRQNWLSNRVFDTYDDILNAACQARKNLLDAPDTITSIGTRKWADNGQDT